MQVDAIDQRTRQARAIASNFFFGASAHASWMSEIGSSCSVSLPNYRWSLTARRLKPGYPKSIKSLGDHLKVQRLDLDLTQK